MTAILSQRLRQAADQHRAADSGADLTLSLQDLLRLHGESSLAVLLMLLAVVSVLPVAGAGTVMSVGIWVVAWSWVRERETLSLPDRLGKLALNERWSGRCLHGLAWLYETSQRCMRPRWAWLSHAGTRAWWGGWIGLMGLVIFVPLPLGNVLPSLSLVLLSLGWMFRDGLALVLSAAAGLAGVAYGVSMGHLAVQALGLMMAKDPLRWLSSWT
jgi:hypothetical protein